MTASHSNSTGSRQETGCTARLRAAEDLGSRLRRITPRNTDLTWYAEVRETLIQIVLATAPRDPSVAQQDLFALIAMAQVAREHHLPITTANLLSQQAWLRALGKQRFIRLAQMTLIIHRSRLTRMAAVHLPDEWPRHTPRPRPLPQHSDRSAPSIRRGTAAQGLADGPNRGAGR